jgi:hypothetical protein
VSGRHSIHLASHRASPPWFPDGPPCMGEEGIVVLIEPCIRGY